MQDRNFGQEWRSLHLPRKDKYRYVYLEAHRRPVCLYTRKLGMNSNLE